MLKGLKPLAKGGRLRLSPLGVLLLLVTAAAFTAGNLRQELALSLLGAVFLSVWMYCLILGLVIALIHRKGAYELSLRLAPHSIAAGDSVDVIRKEGPRFLRLPGILVRCCVRLETRDGRRVEHIFDPDLPITPLHIPLRGAYYPAGDELAVFDALNIFTFSWSLPQAAEARVLASPRPADEALPVYPRAGGREQRAGPHYRRTDDLIDHRPYIPGDDPRRINWKLYSHGPANSLFVREGETEPPPHSQLLILVDTETDSALYSPDAGRAAVDLLCEQALALALDFASRGMDVLVGYTGGALTGGDGEEIARAMSGPFAIGYGLKALGRAQAKHVPRTAAPELPGANRGTCVLALPRTAAGNGETIGGPRALDRFLDRRGASGGEDGGGPAAPGAIHGAAPCEIIFVYPEDAPAVIREAAATAAEGCARLYGSRVGVRAAGVAGAGSEAS